MQHKLYLFLAAVIFTAMQSVNAQNNFMYDNTNTGSSLYEDADGLLGIGTTSPAALLQITQPLTTSPANYFQITATALIPPSTVVEETILKVDASGNVGIGTATPGAPLQIRGKLWYNEVSDFGGAPLQIFTDPSERTIGGFFNAGDETGNPGGSFLVVGNPNNEFPALGVWDPTNEVIPFAVLSNSTIGMGVDVSSSSNFNPEAQVTITKNNDYGHMFKVQSTDQSQNYFDVDNNGHVGVGIEAGTTDGALTVYENGSDTHLDILGTYQHSAIRFFEYGTTHPTHSIGNSDGVLLIDPGLADGLGIDKLKVDGDVYTTAKLGVGIDVQTSSTVAVKGASATTFDLFSSASSGWDNQIRFRNSTGTTRHIITDDLGSNNLVIHPGDGGGANAKVKVDGQAYITGQTGIGIDVQSGSTLALKAASNETRLDIYGTSSDAQDQSVNAAINIFDANGVLQHTITDDDDRLLIGAGAHLSSVADRYVEIESNEQVNNNLYVLGNTEIAGTVRIGNVTAPCSTGSCYSLYVEKGILAERFKCALSSDNTNWSDFVFNKDYKLMDIYELEKFVKKNHHLPNIPSAKEVYRDGIDLGEMNARLLEKIEELTLYMVKQQKEIDALKKNR